MNQTKRMAAGKIYEALQTEFAPETARLDGAPNLGASLDSVYTRVTGISGKPLSDGYHFGQTIINDYGRPYGEGFNNVTGFTSHAVAGPFAISVQGEYQHAPAIASEPLGTLAATRLPTSLRLFRMAYPRQIVFDYSIAQSLLDKQRRVFFGEQSHWMGPRRLALVDEQ